MEREKEREELTATVMTTNVSSTELLDNASFHMLFKAWGRMQQRLQPLHEEQRVLQED